MEWDFKEAVKTNFRCKNKGCKRPQMPGTPKVVKKSTYSGKGDNHSRTMVAAGSVTYSSFLQLLFLDHHRSWFWL